MSRPPSLNRRNLLKKAALGTAAGALTSCGGGGESGPAVQTQPRLNWRLASSFPRSLDTIYGGAEVLAEQVEKLSEGRFRIRCYPQGELVPGLQVLDAIQQGTVQLGHTASYYYTGKNPAFAFDTAVPFGLDSRQQTAWLTEGGGGPLIDELLSDFGILAFPAGNTGAQMGGWFRREVASLTDLRGLKMRIPGLGAQVLSELGVTVQTLAGGEIYPALERGAIDATEWVGPYDDEKLGFHRVANYYYYPGWWEPGPNLSLYINRQAWDSLPALYKDILRNASDTALRTMQARYDALNPLALDRLLGEGVQLRAFGDDILTAARTTSLELMEQDAAKDAGYRKIYEGWKAFRDVTHRWWGAAELAYAQFAYKR
jgi:TRAP-type mannitol/chloroaromatic compound transport system substrate-binding protein